MKAVVVNDPHLADRPPSIRTETYLDDILAKLAFIADLVKERHADAVIFTGDVYHLKAPTRTSHALVQQTIEVVKAYEVPVFAVPGNHDMQHDRLESLDQQPLGVLFRSGAAIPLVGEDPVFGHFFGVPWLQTWKTDLFPVMDEWQMSEASLMVAHAPIVPPGQTRPYEYIDAADWFEMMFRPGDLVHGHMHDADGVYEVEGSMFCNQGALSRGSIHESSLTRKPSVAVYDSETPERFEVVEVPHRPAVEVFRLADKEVEDVRQERLDEFLGSIGRTSLEQVSIEKVMADLRDRGTRSEVVDEAEACFEAVV